MPRYRIAFAREWTLGRWGYLDRFFHDLGGHQNEPSGLDNSWIIEYRGQARHLGRELAKALNIQAIDYRKFGPIFEIEEVPGQHKPKRRPPAAEPSTNAGNERTADAASQASAMAQAFDPSQGGKPSDSAKAASEPRADEAEPQGPSWTANTDVEDAAITESAENDTGAGAFPGSIPGGAGAAIAAGGAAARAQSRWDDLFRIRQQDPTGRRRADAIAGASRRRPAPERPPSE